jgi:hypothetical protein
MKEQILEISKNFNENYPKKYWGETDLTSDQHTFERSKPGPYLKMATQIAKILNMKTVVEIGSTRFALSQKCLDYYNEMSPFVSPPCCGDGHGGIIWNIEGFDVHSCDINPNCKIQAQWSFENIKKPFPENLFLHIPKDGIEFLKEYNDKKIDVLFLDGWDIGTPNYQKMHLDAFITSKDKLSDTHLILIDDTDFNVDGEGKDALLTPHLIELNYVLLFEGRQKLFINKL